MKKNSHKQLIKSIGYALNGFCLALRTETNVKVHLLASVMAVILGFYLQVTPTEAMAITICISMVWCAELFNTAIEKTIDYVSTDVDPKIKFIKDVSAAAVLVTAIAALIIGLLIFIPKLF